MIISLKQNSSAALNSEYPWHFIANYFSSVFLPPPPLSNKDKNKCFLRGSTPWLHTSALNPQDLYSVGSEPTSVCRAHTHSTSSAVIECRCFGFGRLTVAVGALKCLPTAVREGDKYKCLAIFFQTVELELHPRSFPSCFSAYWESS